MGKTFWGIALLLTVSLAPKAFALDPGLPDYQVVTGVSGTMKSVGSDTLNNEMASWAKAFEGLYPDVHIEIEGKGSATAPPALLSGEAQFGPMSRSMTQAESEAFEKKYGYPAAGFRVAVDALSVYVNKDNPIQCLSIPQIDQIFSSTRQASGGRAITNWGEAGLTGDWSDRPINMFGRNDLSGTYEFFKQMALYGGDFRPEVRQEPGSEAVVSEVAKDKFAIGYSGLGYKTDGVRALSVSAFVGGACSDTSATSAYSGSYPMARYLYVRLNKKPNEPLDPLQREFVKFILSKNGQALTEKGGYYPITNEMRQQDLKVLGIPPASQ